MDNYALSNALSKIINNSFRNHKPSFASMSTLQEAKKTVTNKTKKLKQKSKDTFSNISTRPTKKRPSICSLHDSEIRDLEVLSKKYSILKDHNLVKKFLNVPMNNNQKGRIRQLLKESLSGTSDEMLPDIINTRIQSILNGSSNLTDTDLRKVRILYNMLRSAIARIDAKKKLDHLMEKMNEAEMEPKLKIKLERNKDKIKPRTKQTNESGDLKIDESKVKSVEMKRDELKMKNSELKKGDAKENKHEKENESMTLTKETKQKVVKKKKGQKRYVVFVGNLPRDIGKEKLMCHFREIAPMIKDIRIPKLRDETKRPIAYIELENEPSYEMALCKHHTMLGTRRINVLYTTQKKTSVTKSEAKSKSAKLQALIKTGKLVGSVPIEKKRSHRRKKKRLAEQKLANA